MSNVENNATDIVCLTRNYYQIKETLPRLVNIAVLVNFVLKWFVYLTGKHIARKTYHDNYEKKNDAQTQNY